MYLLRFGGSGDGDARKIGRGNLSRKEKYGNDEERSAVTIHHFTIHHGSSHPHNMRTPLPPP